MPKEIAGANNLNIFKNRLKYYLMRNIKLFIFVFGPDVYMF